MLMRSGIPVMGHAIRQKFQEQTTCQDPLVHFVLFLVFEKAKHFTASTNMHHEQGGEKKKKKNSMSYFAMAGSLQVYTI